MKESMYSYHYYKKRAILKPARTAELLFRSVVILGVLFFALSLAQLTR